MKKVWACTKWRNGAALAVMVPLCAVPVAFATPLSDLNREAFEKAVEPGEEGEGVASPFVPRAAVPKEDLVVEELQLFGIVVGDDEAYALVSGNLVRNGDRIAGYRVRQIGTDHIVLQKLDKRVILHLEGGI